MPGRGDNKLLFREKSAVGPEYPVKCDPWVVLVVDDDREVHDLTRLVLGSFSFEGRPLSLLSAFSGKEALQVLQTHADIALVLLDVVMETENAGLEVARQIREVLNNSLVRIVLRTGQAGVVPQEAVFVQYDINDYKDKSELTAERLRTMTIAALRGYRDLLRLQVLNQSLDAQVQQRTAQLERSKRKAEAATHAKSVFLANMSHEIRTPLNAILGFAQLCLRDRTLSPEHKNMLQAIESAGNHLLEVINEVLELSRIEAGAMMLESRDFLLAQLVHDIASLFRLRCEQKGIAWRLQAEGSENIALHGDAGKLRQVLINLLGNAVKFTEQGWVRLGIRQEMPASNTRVRLHFDVADSGPGIAEPEQSLVFEAFQQASAGNLAGGTGLGLAIARQQVELMGGQLQVESQPGTGTRFYFSLDFTPALDGVQLQPGDVRRVLHLAPGYRLTALVVDDVAANRLMLGGLLRDLGVTVDDASNGLEALERLRRQAVDIVFMDIRMPVMNGDEAVAQLRKELPDANIKCVAISAYSMVHEVDDYLAGGFDRYIAKPFRFEAIYQVLQELCGVTYEYEVGTAAGSAGPAVTTASDFSGLVLPAGLHDRISAAARLNRMTEMRNLLQEVQAIPDGGQGFAVHLGKLLARYDTERILASLQQVQRGDEQVSGGW